MIQKGKEVEDRVQTCLCLRAVCTSLCTSIQLTVSQGHEGKGKKKVLYRHTNIKIEGKERNEGRKNLTQIKK
jgi:hypothetical protein